MAKPKSFDQDKRILGVVFLFLFSISFALILFERFTAPLTVEISTASNTHQAVQGAKETRTELERYRGLIKQAALLLFKNAENYGAAGETDMLEVESARGALLVINTPEPYQPLHFELVQFAHALQNHDAYDRTMIAKQYYSLLESYPWLIQ